MLARKITAVKQALFGCLCGGVTVLIVLAVLSHLPRAQSPSAPTAPVALASYQASAPLDGNACPSNACASNECQSNECQSNECQSLVPCGPVEVTSVSVYRDPFPATSELDQTTRVADASQGDAHGVDACVYADGPTSDSDRGVERCAYAATSTDCEYDTPVAPTVGLDEELAYGEGAYVETSPLEAPSVPEHGAAYEDTCSSAAVSGMPEPWEASEPVCPPPLVTAEVPCDRVEVAGDAAPAQSEAPVMDQLERVCSLRGPEGREVVATVKISGQVVSSELIAEPQRSVPAQVARPAVAATPAPPQQNLTSPRTTPQDAPTRMVWAPSPAVSNVHQPPATLPEAVGPPAIMQVRFDESSGEADTAVDLCEAATDHDRVPSWEVMEAGDDETQIPESSAVIMSPTVVAGELAVARRARDLIAEGSLGATIDTLAAGVVDYPNSAMLFRMLGEAYMWRADYETASRALERSITLDKMDPLTNNLFAEALMKLGKQSRADHYYQQAVEATRTR